MTSDSQNEIVSQLSAQIAELIRSASMLRAVGGMNQDEVEDTLREQEARIVLLRRMRQEYEDKVIGNY